MNYGQVNSFFFFFCESDLNVIVQEYIPLKHSG